MNPGKEMAMTTLVVGASGATGRLLVARLLDRGFKVRAIVRSPDKLSDDIRNHANLSVIHASILDLSDAEMMQHVDGCDAVASCLGHNMSFKGVYGRPRMLVTEATRRLCHAIRVSGPERPVRFVLMNTAGNRNRDAQERISFSQRCVVWLLRLLLPPYLDNERSAGYLRTEIGRDEKAIEWAVVRPDNLIDESDVARYDVYSSPTRSAIFAPGVTSRINVAHFMAELIADDEIWRTWRGKMPVIYNNQPAGIPH